MPSESPQAEIRADLIKQLFAIAISIGVAMTLARMSWLEKVRPPTWQEWQQLTVLVTALTATILSWDGYLLSIKNKPLNRFFRFAIDICLVFIYMGLLIVSPNRPDLFLPILAFIFSLYVVWDILSVHEYIRDYDPEPMCVFAVYARGLIDKEGVRRGPIITAFWFVYFVVMARISHVRVPHHFHIMLLCAFAFYGLCVYRWDKIYPADVERNIVGFRTLPRFFAISIALLVAFIAFRIYRI